MSADEMSADFYPSFQTCDSVSSLCPVEATTYGYYPILSVNTFLTVFFGLCIIIQIAFAVRTRTWTYSLALGAGTLLEFLGYVGRILMYYNPWDKNGFQLQICCLILGPSFIAAAIYLTLKHLVLHYGPEFSRLKARLYPWVFVGCDLGSIILQAIGGGVAASAGDTNSQTMLDAGNNLIVAGIAFQIATMVACGLLVLDYVIRLRRGSRLQSGILAAEKSTSNSTPTDSEREEETRVHARNDLHSLRAQPSSSFLSSLPTMSIFWSAVVFAYTTVLIRCIYRLPEMIGGWGNPLMRKEDEFLLLDGMMIAFAVLALTVVHPGVFFTPMRNVKKSKSTDTTASTSTDSTVV